MAWARLSPEVENRIINEALTTLHVSEWDEGSSLWLMDLVIPYGHIRRVLVDLRDVLFPNEERLRYFSSRHGKLVVRKVDRSCRYHFSKSQLQLPEHRSTAG
jgi:hemolysin-activating ACP:hemolysin acyltransferase